MKIYYMSDLHCGVNRRNPWVIPPPPEPGILLLAGDVFDDGIIHNSLIEKLCNEHEHVLFTPGNHEYYHNAIHGGFDTEILKHYLPDNFHFLNCDTFETDQIVVIGATLWTDMEKANPISTLDIVRGMMDFRLISQSPSSECRITSDYIYNIHKQHLDYIAHAYDIHKTGTRPIVVMTHHAPSLQSIHPAFRTSSINGGFVSDLDQFIEDRPNIQYWIHGHTHACVQYQVGSTMVCCNPAGYRGERYNDGDPIQFKFNRVLMEV